MDNTSFRQLPLSDLERPVQDYGSPRNFQTPRSYGNEIELIDPTSRGASASVSSPRVSSPRVSSTLKVDDDETRQGLQLKKQRDEYDQQAAQQFANSIVKPVAVTPSIFSEWQRAQLAVDDTLQNPVILKQMIDQRDNIIQDMKTVIADTMITLKKHYDSDVKINTWMKDVYTFRQLQMKDVRESANMIVLAWFSFTIAAICIQFYGDGEKNKNTMTLLLVGCGMFIVGTCIIMRMIVSYIVQTEQDAKLEFALNPIVKHILNEQSSQIMKRIKFFVFLVLLGISCLSIPMLLQRDRRLLKMYFQKLGMNVVLSCLCSLVDYGFPTFVNLKLFTHNVIFNILIFHCTIQIPSSVSQFTSNSTLTVLLYSIISLVLILFFILFLFYTQSLRCQDLHILYTSNRSFSSLETAPHLSYDTKTLTICALIATSVAVYNFYYMRQIQHEKVSVVFVIAQISLSILAILLSRMFFRKLYMTYKKQPDHSSKVVPMTKEVPSDHP